MLLRRLRSTLSKVGKVAAQDAVHGAARGVQSAVAKFSKGMQGCCVKQPAYRIDIRNCCAKGFALFCLMGRHTCVCVVQLSYVFVSGIDIREPIEKAFCILCGTRRFCFAYWADINMRLRNTGAYWSDVKKLSIRVRFLLLSRPERQCI